MLPTKETQHVATAQALLIDQFKNKTVIQGYLSTLARRVQEVENVLWDIIELRRLDLATGIQLDSLGKLVGEKRIGRNDTDYRTGIRLRIRVNRSKGRIADVIDVAMLASNPLYLPRVTEYSFLGFQVEIYGQTGERYIADLLSRTRAATSYGVLVASDLAASALLVWDDAASPIAGIQTFNDAVSPGPLVCASAYGLPSDFTGIVLGGVAAAPTIASVSTAGGAVGDIAGGYSAAVVGTNFVIGATTFTFGGTAATGVVVSSTTSATMTAPAHAFGAVSVVATTAGGSSAPNTAFEYYSPAQEVLSGWWRAPLASPSAAASSAGTSGANGNLVAGTVPSFASSLNGLAIADWNGSTHDMTNGSGAVFDSTFLSLTGGWSGHAIVNADTAGAADVGSPYQEGAFWSDDGQGYCSLSFSTRGWTIGRYDGNGTGLWREATVACATAGWHIVFFWWDGTNLGIQLDGGAPVTGSSLATPLVTSGTAAVVGRNYSSTAFFDGKSAELAFAKTNLGATFRTKSLAYANTRYNLTL